MDFLPCLAGTTSGAIDLTSPLTSGLTPVPPATVAGMDITPSSVSSAASPLPPMSALLSAATSSTAFLPPSKLRPLVYSPALPPIQPKSLEKIRAGLYFDLKELLPDNMALVQHLNETAMSSFSVPPTGARMREISNPLTWVYCFLSFIAARTDCKATRDLVAYAQIVIQLARKHGGSGWLVYDQHFRQQLAGGADLVWNNINNSLMSATVLAPLPDDPSGSGRTVCRLCRGDDHSVHECALYSLQGPSPHSQHMAHPTRFKPRPAPYRGWESVCRNFNKGLCTREPSQCKYDHVCILCNRAGHGAKECTDRPSGKGKSKAASWGPRSAIKGSADQGST